MNFPADDLNKFRIILASGSPRRRQLLEELGLKFKVITRHYPETFPGHLREAEIAEYLAREKAGLFKKYMRVNEIIITADTIVWCNDRVLGKPSGKDEAVEMIKILSGNTHEVITGVTILSPFKEKTFSDTTKVTFDSLTLEEILFYVENFKPYDKAGAYGIQDWIGLAACSRIEGSYFNVVGLPVQKLYRELQNFIKFH
ncbi:MAG: maf [Bacteroidetes bacterium]|nr:maf [Bacteroidota bacterium]